MSVSVATTRVACNTSTGTQDITTSDLGGLTPVAALFICSYGVTDGTAAADLVSSIGATTGASNRWCLANTSEDAQGTSDCDRYLDADECVVIRNPGAQSVDGEADFSSFITNGVRINWTDAPAAAYLMTVVLFAGTDVSAHANNFTMDQTVDNTVDVTDPGFEPDLLITAHRWGPVDTDATYTIHGLGLVHNDRASGITQRAMCQASFDGQGTSAVMGHCTATYGVVEGDTDATLEWGGEFGSFDSSGFSCTTRIGQPSSAVAYLALRFGSGPAVSTWVGSHTTPTSTGNDSETGPSFTPQFVLMFGTMMEALDTAYLTALAGSLCVSVFDADDEYCTSWADEDNQATTDSQSLSDDTAINMPDDDGSAGITASFVSFDANGWTLNYSAVKANAKYFFALAIEEEAAIVPVKMHHYMINIG